LSYGPTNSTPLEVNDRHFSATTSLRNASRGGTRAILREPFGKSILKEMI